MRNSSDHVYVFLQSFFVHHFVIPSNLIAVYRQQWTLAAGGKSF